MSTRHGALTTKKTWAQSLSDLQDELRKWDVDDYILPMFKESRDRKYVEFSFVRRGEWITVRCNRWKPGEHKWLERNLRALVLAIQAARMADQRGIGELFAQVAQHLALPDKYFTGRSAFEVLGVTPQSTRAQVDKAYRAAAGRAHPDQGGSDAAFIEVRNAWEEITGEKA